MSRVEIVRIKLPEDARYVANGTRVAITGTIVHESKGLATNDPYADIAAYLEIETPRDVTFTDDRAGEDWWVVDAMTLVPTDLWQSICQPFRLIEDAVNDPDWKLWEDLGDGH